MMTPKFAKPVSEATFEAVANGRDFAVGVAGIKAAGVTAMSVPQYARSF